MDMQTVNQLIADGDMNGVESAWIQAADAGESPAVMCQALKALIEARQSDIAEMLAWMLLSDAVERLAAQEALDVAREILPVLPGGPELREMTASLYEQVYAQTENFQALLAASGLQSGQAPRRAIRTLDTCLAIGPGSYLAGRYESKVLRAEGFNAATGCFEVTDARGDTMMLEPKPLADNYEPAGGNDFRVLRAFRPDELAGLVNDDPAAAMIGVCRLYDGRVESLELRDTIVPKYLPKDKWSGWWNRAKTAVKRSEFLTIEGRNPIFVVYHPQGRSLEQELTASVEQARVPLELLNTLKQYVRETKHRKLKIDPEFVSPILETLAEQAESFRQRRPDDALTACLSLTVAESLGLGAPKTPYPPASGLLSEADKPAEEILALANASLRAIALEALSQRPDAADQFARLLVMLPSSELDPVAAKLRAAGSGEVIDRVVAEAMSNPAAYPQVCIWLWQGPSGPLDNPPEMLELLSRLLKIMQDMYRDPHIDRTERRDTCGQIRSALTAGGCKTFRETILKLDEDVAATMKRRVEVNNGLSDVTRESLLGVLREEFYGLFIQAKVEPWLDESVIWTTKASLDGMEAELKDIIDVQMPANSRAIGEAAALGDLSENAEWQYAVEEQRRLQGRVAQLQDDMVRARVLTPGDVPHDSAGIGSRITVSRMSDGQEFELTVLGPSESNVEENVFNYRTPLAQALLGKGIGDTATLKLDGTEREYSIERLESAV